MVFFEIIRMYEKITCEISLLPGRCKKIWQQKKTMCVMQKNMESEKEKER